MVDAFTETEMPTPTSDDVAGTLNDKLSPTELCVKEPDMLAPLNVVPVPANCVELYEAVTVDPFIPKLTPLELENTTVPAF